MSETFRTILQQAEGKNATGIRVPIEVVKALNSGKRAKLKITVNGYTYRSTLANYGEVFLLPFASEHRAASGINAGDAIEVTLELDTEPRLVEVPEDLAQALADANLRAKFDALSPSARKEHVRQVESAKAADTRSRRISTIITKLSEG